MVQAPEAVKVEQAMILAAGKGERMLPLTRDLPKPLLPIGGSTLIQKHLQALAGVGITRVIINVHHLAEKIIETLGDSQFGMEILYSMEPELLETAGGIAAALPLLGNQPFLVVNGDIYTDFPFEKLTTVDSTRLPHLVMVPNPPQHPDGDFTVRDDGVLLAGGIDRRTYSGIGVYQADFFHGVVAAKLKLRPLFDQAILEGRLFGETFDGDWRDIGTLDRYAALKAELQ